MIVQWWLVKHVADQSRNEPINVGLLLQVDNVIFRKFRHVDANGEVDGPHVTGSLRGNTKAYRQWVNYLWEATPTEVEEVRRGPWDPFYVEHAGRVLDGSLPSSPDELLNHLYETLVASTELSEGHEPFEHAVDALVSRVADELKIKVAQKVRVEVRPGRSLVADYSYVNGHPHYMRRARQAGNDAGNGVMALAGYLDELAKAGDGTTVIGFVRLDPGSTNDDAVGLALDRLQSQHYGVVDLGAPDADSALEQLLSS